MYTYAYFWLVVRHQQTVRVLNSLMMNRIMFGKYCTWILYITAKNWNSNRNVEVTVNDSFWYAETIVHIYYR